MSKRESVFNHTHARAWTLRYSMVFSKGVVKWTPSSYGTRLWLDKTLTLIWISSWIIMKSQPFKALPKPRGLWTPSFKPNTECSIATTIINSTVLLITTRPLSRNGRDTKRLWKGRGIWLYSLPSMKKTSLMMTWRYTARRISGRAHCGNSILNVEVID